MDSGNDGATATTTTPSCCAVHPFTEGDFYDNDKMPDKDIRGLMTNE